MMDFHKYHALGNDYIVIDPSRNGVSLTEANIQRICHRNFGIGSDGILYGPLFDGGEISLKILNPDGSEAEKSGNGIRIFSKYLFDEAYVEGRKFRLQTLGGEVAVEILDDQARRIKVDMGTVTFVSDEIPVSGERREVVDETLKVGDEEFKVTCASVGNPHCVIPMQEVSKEMALKLGPPVEIHPLFPNKINVQLLKVIDRQNIQIEIWERGAGYTLASGSSSCAAASAAHKLGHVDSELTVHSPGGQIEIEIKSDGHIFMTGGVTGVMSGQFKPDLREELGMSV